MGYSVFNNRFFNNSIREYIDCVYGIKGLAKGMCERVLNYPNAHLQSIELFVVNKFNTNCFDSYYTTCKSQEENKKNQFFARRGVITRALWNASIHTRTVVAKYGEEKIYTIFRRSILREASKMIAKEVYGKIGKYKEVTPEAAKKYIENSSCNS